MTFRPFDQEIRSSREITKRWRAGVATVKDGETRPTETAIEFTVRHSKDYKAFFASITPIEIGEYTKQWCSDNPGVRFHAEKVARYSDKALAEFAERAYARLIELADEPAVAKYIDQLPVREQVAA